MSKKEEKVEKVTIPAEMFACLDDKGENCIVEIELPSVSKKNIQLSMQDDLVQVRAERKDLAFLGHLALSFEGKPKEGGSSVHSRSTSHPSPCEGKASASNNYQDKIEVLIDSNIPFTFLQQ